MRQVMTQQAILLLCVSSLWLSCSKSQESVEAPEPIIASVENRKLYQKELEQVIHPASSTKDSAAIANAYIDQWVRDQLLMKEASRYFASDFEIEKLVDDYREKLIKFNFEQKIIEDRFDTTVTSQQFSKFYDLHKEQFVLKEGVYRVQMVQIPRKTKNIDNFYRDWRSDEAEAVAKYIEQNAVQQALDEKRWYTWPQIESWCEGFNEGRAQKPGTQRIRQDDIECFLKVLEYRGEKEISPLLFIQDQLKQMILHHRKQEIIENYKSELYNKAIDHNIIKIKPQ